MKPHRHAEVIKAWVDARQVEVMDERTGTWVDMAGPDICPITHFDGPGQYRIKPERIYPVTRLDPEQLRAEYNSDFQGTSEPQALFRIVNFALRHAIDAGQVVTMDNHAAALASTREQERQFGLERLGRRDMAIAEAVHQAAKICTCPVASPEVFRMIGKLNLAAIIATVKD